MLIFLASCAPNIQEQATVTVQIHTLTSPPFAQTSTVTVTPIATRTPIPITATHPSPTSTRLPGYDLAFFFTLDNSIYRYSMMDWTPEKLDLPIVGDMYSVLLSPGGRYLAYFDDDGLKQYDRDDGSLSIIASSVPGFGRLALYTEDEKLLAFNDAEGLKIYNIESGTTQLVIRHVVLDQDYISANHYFFPYKWSPDNKWLVIAEGYYEGSPNLSIYDLSTLEIYDLTDCRSDVIWDPNSSTLYYSVSYSGYSRCGENPGIFQATYNGNSFIEQPLYLRECSIETEECWFSSLGLDSSGEILSFIERIGEGWVITLLFSDGTVTRDASPSRIWSQSLIWFDTSHELIYANQEGVYKVATDTFEKYILAPLSSDPAILLLSPAASWLIVEMPYQRNHYIRLIEVSTHFFIDVRVDRIIGWDNR